MNYIKDIKEYLEQELEAINSLDLEKVNEVMNVLENARLEGKRIYICGNGGSGSTASHFCCDFNKVCDNKEKKYSIECLNDNLPTILAVSNDYGYDEVFRYQLKNKMKEGDIFIGISGSGNSMNVVNAMDYANSIGGTTIAIVGYDGGKIKKMADHTLHVNINNMQVSEDVHLILNHIMTYIIRNM